MEKKTRYLNILKAVLTRIVVITHIAFLYMSFYWQTDEVLLCAWMVMGVLLICTECIYTSIKRQGQDFKWASPMIFIYIITAYIPCLVSYHVEDFYDMKETCESINFQRRLIFNNLELFFIIVILARWWLPKGKITLEELSKLLLTYMSVIADILDIMKMIRTISLSKCKQSLKDSFFTFSLTILSISTLQLCLSLTAKRSKTARSNEQIDIDAINAKYKAVKRRRVIRFKLSDSSPNEETKSGNSSSAKISTKTKHDYFYKYCYLPSCKCKHKFLHQVRKIFEKEVWGIFVSLLIKDIPFSIVRTYAIIVPPSSGPYTCSLWQQSLFFQLKNYLTIVIQLNRCYVLYNLNDDNKSSGDSRANDKKAPDKSTKSNIEGRPVEVTTVSSSLGSTSPSSNNTLLAVPILTKTTASGMATLEVTYLDMSRFEGFSETDGQQELGKRKSMFWKKNSNKIEVRNSDETKQNLGLASSKSNTLTVNNEKVQRSSVISEVDSSISQGPLIF